MNIFVCNILCLFHNPVVEAEKDGNSSHPRSLNLLSVEMKIMNSFQYSKKSKRNNTLPTDRASQVIII